MEIIGGLIGAGLVAVAPMVPALRPVAKAFVKGGMAVAGVTVAVVTTVTEQVSDLMAQTHAELAGETIIEAEVAPVTTGETPAPDMPVSDVPSTAAAVDATSVPAAAAAVPGLRPLAMAGLKGGIALADAAKRAARVAAGTAAAGGQQLGALASSLGRATQAEPVATDDNVAALAAAVAEASTTSADVITADATASGVPDEAAAAHEDATLSDPEPEAVTPLPALETQTANTPMDDLLCIKGVGPKSKELLAAAGITTFAQLAATPVDHLQAMLQQAGRRYAIIDPTSWPAQAQALLADPTQA